jgi:hypothetical protein
MFPHLFIIPATIIAIPVTRLIFTLHGLMKKEVKQLIVDADKCVTEVNALVVHLDQTIIQLQTTITNLDAVLKQSDLILQESSGVVPQTMSNVNVILANKIPETISILEKLLQSTDHVMKELDLSNIVHAPAHAIHQAADGCVTCFFKKKTNKVAPIQAKSR